MVGFELLTFIVQKGGFCLLHTSDTNTCTVALHVAFSAT